MLFFKVQIMSPDHSTNAWNKSVLTFDLSINTCRTLFVRNQSLYKFVKPCLDPRSWCLCFVRPFPVQILADAFVAHRQEPSHGQVIHANGVHYDSSLDSRTEIAGAPSAWISSSVLSDSFVANSHHMVKCSRPTDSTPTPPSSLGLSSPRFIGMDTCCLDCTCNFLSLRKPNKVTKIKIKRIKKQTCSRCT